jgi:hypothetical protein
MVTDIESQSSFDLFCFYFCRMEFFFWTKSQLYPIAIWIEIQFTKSQEKNQKKPRHIDVSP